MIFPMMCDRIYRSGHSAWRSGNAFASLCSDDKLLSCPQHGHRQTCDIHSMAWSFTAFAAVVAGLWLLLLAAAQAWKRLRSGRDIKSYEHGNDDDGDDGQPRSLHTQLGWFWLVVACHLDGSESRVWKGPKTTTSSRSRQPSYTFLKTFYTVGSLCALLAFVSIPLYLLLELYFLMTSNDTSPSSPSNNNPNTILPGLLVPGLTIPLRDWFVLFLAGFFAIAWHEAGHAITAVLAKVEITSFAFILIFVFPGAYVALDKTALDSLHHASAKLRIITAGVWNNVVLCLFVYMGMRMNLLQRDSGIYRYFGYSDMNDFGVVVQLVNKEPSLNGLISQQQLITHLDDVELHDSYLYKHWDNYLLSNDEEQAQNYDSLGFCVDRDMYVNRPLACCSDNITSIADSPVHGQDRQVCYLEASQSEYPSHSEGSKTNHNNKGGHCLDPGELLNLSRCTSKCNQNDNQICIHPSPTSNLLRITIRNSNNGDEEIIMYRGRKSQLWNDIKIGRYLAPFTWMQNIPLDIESFWLYTSSISLSLALFNLLPLPRLDGGEILDTLLSTSTSRAFAPVLPFSRDNKNIGSLYSDNGREGKLDRILERSVTILQGILANGNGTKQGGMSPNRKKYVRIAIQGTVALLAGLNFAANIYRQLYP